MKSGSSLKRNISIGNCLGGTLPNASENAAARFSKSETSRRPFISFVSVNSRKWSDETSNHFASFAAESAGIAKTNKSAKTMRRINKLYRMSIFRRSERVNELETGVFPSFEEGRCALQVNVTLP